MDWTYIDDVLVDVVESETPTFSNEITEKPVEDGTVITDHINNNPVTFSLNIVITGEYGDTPQEKYERLLEIRDNREIITVVGALQVYENMAISELSLEKTVKNIKGYSGTVSFQQVKFATAETIIVEVAPPVIDGEKQPAPEKESGETSTKDSESENVDEETVNNKSLPIKLFESVFGSDGDN
jgi:hypothetical protein